MPIDPKDLADMKDFHDRNFSNDGESCWVKVPGHYELHNIAQAPAMYELLKKLELSNHSGDGFYCCPVCGGEVEDKNRTRGICVSALGHNDGCELDAVLKAVEGEESAR